MITAYIDIIGAGDRKLIEITERAVKLFPYNRNFLLLSLELYEFVLVLIIAF